KTGLLSPGIKVHSVGEMRSHGLPITRGLFLGAMSNQAQQKSGMQLQAKPYSPTGAMSVLCGQWHGLPMASGLSLPVWASSYMFGTQRTHIKFISIRAILLMGLVVSRGLPIVDVWHQREMMERCMSGTLATET